MRSNNDYAVGYGRPPKGPQFKKGQSGNPGGRPKGSKSWKALAEEVLNEKIDVIVKGKSRKISIKRALVRQAAHAALRNNDLKMLTAMGAFNEAAEVPAACEELPEGLTVTLMFDNEPQITTRNGEVVMDHRIARWKDSDESDWL